MISSRVEWRTRVHESWAYGVRDLSAEWWRSLQIFVRWLWGLGWLTSHWTRGPFRWTSLKLALETCLSRTSPNKSLFELVFIAMILSIHHYPVVQQDLAGIFAITEVVRDSHWITWQIAMQLWMFEWFALKSNILRIRTITKINPSIF